MDRTREKRLVCLASRQFGLLTLRDLAGLSLSRSWILRRVETGEYVRVHRGVFRLGAHQFTADARDLAAVLAAGGGAALSHLSAARRLGLDVPPDRLVHVAIPMSQCATPLKGVKLWRSRNLSAAEVIRQGPLRLTDLGRTIIDLAAVLNDGWLRAALDSALRQRRANLSLVAGRLSQGKRGHTGIQRLRRLLLEYASEADVPDSALESLGLALGSAVKSKPELHWRVFDGSRFVAEVDLAWPEIRLCVEFDGWIYHGTRAAFIRDRARDRALSKLGWTVLRYTWHDVSTKRATVQSELVNAYQSRVHRSVQRKDSSTVNDFVSPRIQNHAQFAP